MRLHVIGEGRYSSYLQSIANRNIIFFGRVSDKELRDQYSSAQAFIYPQVEDFGLMPLEAASCGTPTIALAKAGSLETVLPGITGELVENFDSETVKNLIHNWDVTKYNPERMKQHAMSFSKDVFQENIRNYVNEVINHASRN